MSVSVGAVTPGLGGVTTGPVPGPVPAHTCCLVGLLVASYSGDKDTVTMPREHPQI